MGWERSRTDNFTHYQCFYLCHSLCAPPSTCSFSTDLRASTLPRHNCHLQTQLIYRPLFSLKCENLQGSELTLALDKSPDCEGPSHLRVFPDESTSTQRRHLQTVGESPCQDQNCVSQMKNKTGGAGSDQCTKIQFQAPKEHQIGVCVQDSGYICVLVHLCPCSSSHRKMPYF